MEWIPAKSILRKVTYGNEWYGVDYVMNLYRGCPHGCIYCDSRSECYHIDNFDIPKGKEHTLFLLKKELQKQHDHGVIGIGSMSDTYHPLEQQYHLTRDALSLIQTYHFGVAIDTKSDLILRDIDVLKQIQERNNVIVKFTITTPHDAISSMIEPHVAVSSKRFAAIRTLRDAGIFAGIMMNPSLPFITDDPNDILELVRLAHEAGACFIHTYLSMTLRDRQRDYYYEQLDVLYPGYKERYQTTYGNRYSCTIPHAKETYQLFAQACRHYHILYRMEDIIAAYKKEVKTQEQLSLFG